VFGWHLRIGPDTNPRMLRNFPMQANGAEMLRWACCLGIERGIEVCAPVHDAVLICAPLEQIEDNVVRMRQCMAEASRAVLNGFELATEAKIVRYPDRYMDKRGTVMWKKVMELTNARSEGLARGVADTALLERGTVPGAARGQDVDAGDPAVRGVG